MAASNRRRFEMPAIDQPDPEPGFQHTSDEFIIPATDEEGESMRCQFRAPATLHGWMSDIVASRKFPFRFEGDLMRYGLYLACVQLSRIEKGVPSLQADIDAASTQLRRRANAAKVIEHLDKLAETLADLQSKKAWGEIVYVLAGERRFAEASVLTEPYWGQRWVDGLQERFADVLTLAESKIDTHFFMPKDTSVGPTE